jgi:hypothetical protein
MSQERKTIVSALVLAARPLAEDNEIDSEDGGGCWNRGRNS